MIYCANHGGRTADFHCERCQTAFCRDCVSLKAYDRGKMEICPLCNNPVTNLGPYQPIRPFWTNIPAILTWPLRDNAWMMLVGWAFASLFLLGFRGFCIALPSYYSLIGISMVSLLYYGLLIAYFYKIINAAEDGNFKVPDWAAFKGLGGSALLIGRFIFSMLAVFWPFVIFVFVLFFIHGSDFTAVGQTLVSPLGIIIIILSIIVGIALLPMAILVMGVFGSLTYVLNPFALFENIRRILAEYFIMLAMLTGLLGLYALIYLFFNLVLATISSVAVKILFYYPLDGALQLYLFMVVGHLLGYMAYQCRYKLKWWPEYQHEPIFMVAGKPTRLSFSKAPVVMPAGATASGVAAVGVAAVGVAAVGVAAVGVAAVGVAGGGASIVIDQELSRKITDGMSMISHGRHQEAAALFEEILVQHPNNLGALRGMVMASIKIGDLETAKKWAVKQGAQLAREKAFDAMWEIYNEIRKSIADFSFAARDQLPLSRWLSGQGMDIDSARVLRELAVANPDDPFAPKALYQCAEILWKRCDKGDTAAQMLEYILKRYPDVAFADQVRIDLAQIRKPGG